MDQLPVKTLADLKSFEESLADVNVVKGLVRSNSSITDQLY